MNFHKESVRAISNARLWHRCLYTCILSTSTSLTTLNGVLILRLASHLDALSAYPIQTQIPSGAPGGTTGKPEVCPSRSSRTSAVSYTHLIPSAFTLLFQKEISQVINHLTSELTYKSSFQKETFSVSRNYPDYEDYSELSDAFFDLERELLPQEKDMVVSLIERVKELSLIHICTPRTEL